MRLIKLFTFIESDLQSETQEFIRSAGLSDNISILEIGCGTGEMAAWLAQQFPMGKILATDINAEQLIVAEKTAQ